jgi:hypothetical protein
VKYTQPIVEVVWNDAETMHGWETNDECDTENVPIITVGFLIAKGSSTIIVASSIDQTNGTQNNSRIKIPIGMIVSIKELNVSHKKSKQQPSEGVDSGAV